MIALGDCRFDPGTEQLLDAAGRPVRLRNKSLRTLMVLADPPGRLVTKDEIIAKVWDQAFVSDESLAQCIADIRRGLGDTKREIVQTLPGRGFLLVGRAVVRGEPGELPAVAVEDIRVEPRDSETALVAERIGQELVRAIARRRGIRVQAHAPPDAQASYRIRGAARHAGNRLTVFMEIDETDGRGTFYTESFALRDETVDDFVERVARKVTNVQRVSAVAYYGQRLLHVPDADLDLQQLLQKAAYHLSRITVDSTEAASQVLEGAIARFPDSPMALAMLAMTYTNMFPLTAIERPADRVAEAMALAERAVFAGPEVDFALRTRGNVKFWLLRDHAGAIADCRRALAITPNYQLAHLLLVECELFAGDAAAAKARLDRHIEVDLALPQYHFFQTLYALCALALGDEAGARRHAREAYEYAPWSDWGVLVMCAAHAADAPDLSPAFAARIAACALGTSHFGDLPITSGPLLDLLVARAALAGLPPGGAASR